MPIYVGGVMVNAGDVVIGDQDGVVVVAREALESVLNALADVKAKEAKMDELVRERRQAACRDSSSCSPRKACCTSIDEASLVLVARHAGGLFDHPRRGTRGFELITLEQNSDDERREKVATCEVVIVAATPLRKPVIDAAKRIELVHHQGVGWQDTTDHAELKQRGIPLALTPEGTTIGVAEHTVLLILAALKLLPYADSELRQGRFHINALRPISRELSGLTVGYIGMGRIAQAVAERLRAFGTHGIFFDPERSRGATVCRARSFEQVLQAGGRASHLHAAADCGDAPHDRRGANRADEARRVSDQYGARRSDR